MADLKISDATSGAPAQSADIIPIVRGATPFRLSVGDVSALSLPIGGGTLTGGLIMGSGAHFDAGAQAPGVATPIHLFAGAGANSNWPVAISSIYDASNVDLYITLNAKLTGGTRSSPTFMGNSSSGGMYIRETPLDGGFAGGLIIGKIPAGTNQSPLPLIELVANGNIGFAGKVSIGTMVKHGAIHIDASGMPAAVAGAYTYFTGVPNTEYALATNGQYGWVVNKDSSNIVQSASYGYAIDGVIKWLSGMDTLNSDFVPVWSQACAPHGDLIYIAPMGEMVFEGGGLQGVAPAGQNTGMVIRDGNFPIALRLETRGGVDQPTQFIISSKGTLSTQEANLQFHTIGGDQNALGTVANRGWMLAARGNQYTTAADRNSLFFNAWTGSAWVNMLSLRMDKKVGVCVQDPTAVLHLAAATAAAETASLKIPSGVVATTPAAGNIEADANHIYWTKADGTRLQLDNV